jgi:hypothetical protein
MKSLTKLIAYILTDGCVTIEGDNGLYLTFVNKNLNLIRDFQEVLKELGLESTITKHGNDFRVRKGSKKIASKIIKLCNLEIKNKSISKENVKIPEFISNDRNMTKLFLKIVASTEGYVKLTRNKSGGYARRITLGSSNEKLKSIYSLLLGKLEISSRIAENEVKIYGLSNFKKFRRDVNFVKGCRVVRGPKRGIEKSVLLDKMISTYPSW